METHRYGNGNKFISSTPNIDDSFTLSTPNSGKKFTSSTPDIRVTPSLAPIQSAANKFGHNSVDVVSLIPSKKTRSHSVHHHRRVHITERIDEETVPVFRNIVTNSDPGKLGLKIAHVEHNVADVEHDDESSRSSRSNRVSVSLKKKKMPRLNLLNIQENTSDENSPCLSSRRMDKRQSDLDNIFKETYPLNGIGHLNPIVDKTGDFDKNLNDHLQKTWSSALKKLVNQESPKPLSECVEKSYRIFLASEIDALCQYDRFEPQDLLKHQSPRVIQLYNYIQKGGVPFKEIFPRFRLLRSILDRYLTEGLTESKRNISPYATKLYTLIDRFLEKQKFPATMNVEKIEDNDFFGFKDDYDDSPQLNPITSGREIEHFLKVYDEVMHLVSEKKETKLMVESLKRWALAPLGETELERDNVIKKLREWVALTSIEQAKLFEQLKADTWSISRTSYYISQISTIFHRWYQNSVLCENSLSTISYSQIYHKWKGMVTAFNLVTVNGKTFWDSNTKHLGVTPRSSEIHARKSPRNHSPKNKTNSGITEIKTTESQKTEYTIKEIFEGLFTAMSGREKNNVEIVCQVAEFVAATKDTSFQTSDIETRIPWISIMRLTTDRAWDEAHIYMGKLFPELFMPPYSVKYEGRRECIIDVKESEVIQKKEISVYLTSGKEGTMPKKQVNLFMSWSLKPMRVGLEGALSIEHYEVIDENNWVDLRRKLVETVDVFNLPDNPKGIKFCSDLPTDLYSRKRVTNKGRSTSLNTAKSKGDFGSI